MGRRASIEFDVPAVRRDGFALPLRRAGLYVDGFNLHHALLEFDEPELMWLDLRALGRRLIGRGERLTQVVWASAHRPQRRDRAEPLFTYERALRASGVRCLMGHFVMHGEGCRACGHVWTRATEKQSDVNLALAVAADAMAGRIDAAYLVTGDGDHAATVRYLAETHPRMQVVSVAPPGRGHNRQLLRWATARTEIAPAHVRVSQLPDRIVTRAGIIVRPDAWRPDDPAPAPDPTDPPSTARAPHLRLVVSNT